MNTFVLWSLLLALYFLPYINALSRKHRSAGAILVINLFLGWTVLGWIIALAWSCNSNVRTKEQGA
jgi:hypothetical protein